MATETDASIERIKCLADPAYFIDTYGMIDTPQMDGVASVRFRLWPEQTRVMWTFATSKRVVVLKARQLGVSWLACGYVLWLCLFYPGRMALLFSKGQLEANELARRVGALYWRLPAWLRAALPALSTDNTSELAWENGSRVQSLPATENAGRSFTASIALMDEAAHMQWAEKIYNSLKPTVDGGGQLLVVSTANGRGNMFSHIWSEATAGKNGFTPLFLPWWARPDRTADWYADTSRAALSQALMDQEYPASPEDAFSASESDKFIDILWWDACREDLPALTQRTPVVLALDGGIKNDSFGLCAVSRHPSRPGDIAVRYAREWKPPRDGAIDFDGSEDAPGPLREVERLCRQFNVVEVAYDPYQLHYAAGLLRAKGFAVVREFSQGEQRLEADKQLRDLVLHRQIAHNGDESLRRHMDNANAKVDAESRRLRIVKREDSLKVDLAVCLSMAAFRCLRLPL